MSEQQILKTIMQDDDTTKMLWEWYFKARIPEIASKTEEELKMYGVRLSLIKEIDKDIGGNWLTVMLTINQMIDYYKRGVPVKIVTHSDTEIIYEAISRHIYKWRDYLQKGINIGDAPIEDLVALDEFANIVYEHAKHIFTREISESIIGQRLTDLVKFNPDTFFNKSKINAIFNNNVFDMPEVTSEKENERDTLAEFFKNRLSNSDYFKRN